MEQKKFDLNSFIGFALIFVIIFWMMMNSQENNAKEIQLQVNRHNHAKDFYLKQGFTILYEADFEIGNGFYIWEYTNFPENFQGGIKFCKNYDTSEVLYFVNYPLVTHS